MNVLFHTYWYPYNGSVDGVFIKEHAKSSKTAGVNIAVQAIKVLPAKTFYSASAEFITDENGVPTYYLVIKSRFWKWIYIAIPLLYLLAKRHYKQHIAPAFLPDVLVANVINPAGITGYWLAKKLKCRFIIIEHWTRIPKFIRVNLFASTAKKAYRSAEVVITVSGFLKDMVISYGAKPERVKIIPNTVDNTVFYYGGKQPSETLNFLFIAGLRYPKDPFIIIKALNRIAPNSAKPIVLNIIGDGPYRAQLEALATTSNFTINLLGMLPKAEVGNQLRKADFLLHASYLETFSLVVAEAICCGTPVCASNIPPLDDLVNDENGILANNTEEEWVSGIEKLLSRPYNLQAISKSYCKKFSTPEVGRQLKQAFDNAIA